MNSLEKSVQNRVAAKAKNAPSIPCREPRVPDPGPNADLRPPMGGGKQMQHYMQGDKLPPAPSVINTNSKYLNNPYYREAYATQALRRYGKDVTPTYMVPLMLRAIDEVTDKARLVQLVAEERVKKPDFAAWLDERRYTAYTRENTARYEAGTFGHAIHEFLGISGIDIEFAARAQGADSDVEYLFKRRAAGHDIEHIVTNFTGSNTAGETALAFVNVASDSNYFTPELAQMLSATTVWVSSTSYNRIALHYHHALPATLDAMRQGIDVGLAIKQPLFMNQWEDYLDWTLEAIADKLGFTRGPGEEWLWTNAACSD